MYTIIETFLEYLRVERRYSPKTILAYGTDLKQFADFLRVCAEINDIALAKHPSVRAWIMHIMGENGTPVTVNRKISALRSFYKWATKRKWVDTNPMLKVLAPKKPKKLPEVVPGANMTRLFEIGSEEIAHPNDFEGTRDVFLLELLYATGMRRAEIIALTVSDVDISRREIRVLGKGNKVRSIPITDQLVRSFNKYLSVRSEIKHILSDHLFIRENGKPLYDKLVYRIVKTRLSAVTTLGKKSPHVLRHSFATHMLDEGADLNAIKELLGHASLAATQVYTHNSITKLKEVYKKAHPKG